MENLYLSALVRELAPAVTGRSVSKVSLANSNLLIDLRLQDGRVLVASLAPSSPALYLSDSSPRELEKEGRASNPFITLLRKALFGTRLTAISKDPRDRVVWLDFEGFDASGSKETHTLVCAFTGRSANAFLLDSQGEVETSLHARGVTRMERPSPEGSLPDPREMGHDSGDSTTDAELLERYFGADSVFGPALKNEFIARCRIAEPSRAFRLLLRDLFEREPVPLVYSRVPLVEVGKTPLNLKADILLSHVELTAADGLKRYEFATLSEAADNYYQARERAKRFQSEYSSTRKMLTDEIKKRRSLLKAFASDRERFGDPDTLKRFGDLILANLATARASGSSVRVVDYYDASQPEIEIEIEEGISLQQAATVYFNRYQKARRALQAIHSREAAIAAELGGLNSLLDTLDAEPTPDRFEQVRTEARQLLGKKVDRASRAEAGRKPRERSVGRRFVSSDGFEIVVGKNDRDNDSITFRIARPQDVWMHAADYPGSHVVVRNPTRGDVPHRTLTEAAELAAFYSQARREGKAAVHYTQKKFVTKPPRSKSGLVRLSSFKTLMVEPRCNVEKVE